MTESTSHGPTQFEQRLFKLSQEQADQLDNTELGTDTYELLHEFGAIGLTGNVALVYAKDESGDDHPSHYIELSRSDLGTRINLDRNQNAERLPSIADAHEILQKLENPSVVEDPSIEDQENKFAHFFEKRKPADIGPGSELTAPNETERNTRVEELFAPRLTNSERPKIDPKQTSDSDFYTRLLKGEPALQTAETYQEKLKREAEDAKYITEPTDEQKRTAWGRLHEAESDLVIEAIISKYVTREGPRDPVSVTDTLRTNADLRYELGSYLLRDKLPKIAREQPHDIPSRVFVGGQKSPNHRGYAHLGHINSREYAVILALSMLDGTFSDPGIGDPIERNSKGYIELGQHRAAAEVLLSPIRRNIG